MDAAPSRTPVEADWQRAFRTLVSDFRTSSLAHLRHALRANAPYLTQGATCIGDANDKPRFRCPLGDLIIREEPGSTSMLVEQRFRELLHRWRQDEEPRTDPDFFLVWFDALGSRQERFTQLADYLDVLITEREESE